MRRVEKQVRFSAGIIAVAVAATFGVAAQAAPGDSSGPIQVHLDAREAARHILHVRETIPVSPGPVTLAYPKWIPGEHGPTGPVIDLVDLKITAGGKAIAWRRDPADMFLYQVDPPAGTTALEVAFDQLTPANKEGFGAAASASAQLAIIAWNQFVLYARGANAADIKLEADISLPEGWKYGTALRVASESGATIRFKPASLITLIDSPILAGAHFRTERLSKEGDPRPAYLHVAADSDAALQARPEIYDRYRRLVSEEMALFGARHYDEYHFLLALSEHVAHFGLEHHESSDNRIPERGLIDDDIRPLHADLLAHEMTHSWNAKYRRPKGLVTADYQTPIDSRMLWVYEGLTNYLGVVLAGRSGLYSPEEFRDMLAWMAAEHSIRPGRAWRPLEDTGTEAQLLYEAPKGWESLRRSVDFYEEGTFLWLEVDMLIRQKSGGKKSLDDFCKAFYGPPDSSPKVVPYTDEEVFATLNTVVENDWRGFFRERVVEVRPGTPLGGLEASGWHLGYSETKTPRLKAQEGADEITDARFSIGALIGKDDRVVDVLGDSPAARAGLAPGMRLVAVDGRRFERDILEDAIKGTRAAGHGSLDLLVENADFFRTLAVPYGEGLKYPVLERRTGVADTLSDIIRAHAPGAPAPAARPKS
ncbi:MAG TPA: peptidase M61 [Dongiaceae bacterium]|nr:peptidase M61 [Dongiaceae bacterium]